MNRVLSTRNLIDTCFYGQAASPLEGLPIGFSYQFTDFRSNLRKINKISFSRYFENKRGQQSLKQSHRHSKAFLIDSCIKVGDS